MLISSLHSNNYIHLGLDEFENVGRTFMLLDMNIAHRF